MRKNLTEQTVLLCAFIFITLISCSKKDDNGQPAVVPPVTQPTPKSIGAIVDSGLVSTAVRAMVMDLNDENFALYTSNEDVSYVSAKVRVAFYVNVDGVIPSGDYNLSTSVTKTAFTFDSGVLMLTVGSDASKSSNDQISDGTITVSQSGDKYVFTLNVTLSSGFTTSQIFSGTLAYSDGKK